jgi:hypothetical protein
MKFRILLALFLAAWIGNAAAQYGEGPDEDNRIYTGLWWNPNESGWGINTTHQGNLLFATLFTYAPDGEPLWLVASGLVGNGMYNYSGPLYRTTGPPFYQTPWTGFGFQQVGIMSITWTTPTTASLLYTFNNVTVRKDIQRQVFASPVPECVVSSASRATETNYQDLWWNPDESGWGINLVHQGNVIFATLFTYSETGRDKWFVASGLVRQTDGSFTGGLYSTTGPAYNANPWPGFQFQQVGNMTLRFTNGETGTLTYNVGATPVTKQIQRQVFQAGPSACR